MTRNVAKIVHDLQAATKGEVHCHCQLRNYLCDLGQKSRQQERKLENAVTTRC
jgi:hypothetical protein